MKRVRLSVWGVVGLLVLGLGVGCNGMQRSGDEYGSVYEKSVDRDTRGLVDDWNTLWLADRQQRLSKTPLR